MSKVKIIYILGAGRSGSTVLSMLLGELNGVFDAGEVRFIFERGMIRNNQCGCAEKFNECTFWTKVISDLAIDKESVQKLFILQEKILRLRFFPFVKYSILRKFIFQEIDLLLNVYMRLYSSIAKHADDAIILDSSKSPSYGFLLSLLPSVDVYYVHLIRNPSAVSFSFVKTKKYETKSCSLMKKFGIVESSMLWLFLNFAAHFYFGILDKSRYHKVYYDDFVSNPSGCIRTIVSKLNVQSPVCSGGGANNFLLSKTHHSIAGNPVRFTEGSIAIRKDSQWIECMSFFDKFKSKLFSCPLFFIYVFLRKSNK